MINEWRDKNMEEILFIETGTGVEVHGQDVNEVASRAVPDAIHYNPMPGIRQLLRENDLPITKVTVKIAIPHDIHTVNLAAIEAAIPCLGAKIDGMEGRMA